MRKLQLLTKKILSALMLMLMLFTCACTPAPKDPDIVDVSPTMDQSGDVLCLAQATHTYAVSTSNRLATDVGMRVLENGGNAVDAAIAVAYTLSVVQPYASGLGGGGCLLLYDPKTSEYAFYNYFAAMRSTSTSSKNSIGIPGFVRGLDAVYDDYATMDLLTLLTPAINYAESGITVAADVATRIRVAWQNLKDNPIFYNENNKMLVEGDTLYQKDLAHTMRLIAANGSEVFYSGEVAQAIVADKTTDITMTDMGAYTVEKSKPVISTFLGKEIASAPAPFAGVTVIQMLRMAEALDMANPAENAQQYLDQLYSITARAYSDRLRSIADPKFINVDEQALVSASHIADLLNVESVTIEDDPEHTSTTSFSIIDGDGMVVSSTNTLSSFWGSRCHVSGVYLNNTMKHFAKTGKNAAQPGKMPRSYCAPTIIRGENGYILSIGTPGGNNIPKILVPVLVDYLKFGTDLQEAIFKGRIFSRNTSSVIVEVRDFFALLANVDSTSYRLVKRDDAAYFGNIAAVGYSPEQKKVFSAYDDRRGGTSVSSTED